MQAQITDYVRCCQYEKQFSPAEAQNWGNGWVREEEFTGDLIQEGTCTSCQIDNQRIGSSVRLGDLETGDLLKLPGNRDIYVHAGRGAQERHIWVMSDNGEYSGDADENLMVEYRGKSNWY